MACTRMFIALMLAASALVPSGCAVRLIMDYDSALDQSISKAQADTEQFLSKLDYEVGTSAASLTNNKDFYPNMDAQLRTLQTRVDSEPKSAIIVRQMAELRGSYDDLWHLQQLDGDKGLSHVEITAARSGIENQFRSMLTLQLALKNRLRTPMTTETAPPISK